MAYSIVEGFYYYGEPDGDYFEFRALLDESDHLSAWVALSTGSGDSGARVCPSYSASLFLSCLLSRPNTRPEKLTPPSIAIPG